MDLNHVEMCKLLKFYPARLGRKEVLKLIWCQVALL